MINVSAKTVIVNPVKIMKIYSKHSTQQEETGVEGGEMRWKAKKKEGEINNIKYQTQYVTLLS